jgi:hypothetical protein
MEPHYINIAAGTVVSMCLTANARKESIAQKEENQFAKIKTQITKPLEMLSHVEMDVSQDGYEKNLCLNEGKDLRQYVFHDCYCSVIAWLFLLMLLLQL